MPIVDRRAYGTPTECVSAELGSRHAQAAAGVEFALGGLAIALPGEHVTVTDQRTVSYTDAHGIKVERTVSRLTILEDVSQQKSDLNIQINNAMSIKG